MSATIGRGCCVWRPSVLRNGGAVNGKRKLAPAGAPNLLNACFFRENHYWKSLVSNATAPANSGARRGKKQAGMRRIYANRRRPPSK